MAGILTGLTSSSAHSGIVSPLKTDLCLSVATTHDPYTVFDIYTSALLFVSLCNYTSNCQCGFFFLQSCFFLFTSYLWLRHRSRGNKVAIFYVAYYLSTKLENDEEEIKVEKLKMTNKSTSHVSCYPCHSNT